MKIFLGQEQTIFIQLDTSHYNLYEMKMRFMTILMKIKYGEYHSSYFNLCISHMRDLNMRLVPRSIEGTQVRSLMRLN